MIIGPQLPGGFSVFCDDIRQELNGKVSLIGTYAGEMTVYGTPPTRLTQLAVLIAYRDDPQTFPKDVAVKIHREGAETETIFSGNFSLPDTAGQLDLPCGEDDTSRFAEFRMLAKFPGIEFPGPCILKVRAYVGDDEIRLGALEIKFVPQSETPPEAV